MFHFTSTTTLPMPLHAFELAVTLTPSEIDPVTPNATEGVPVMLVHSQVLIDGRPLVPLHNPLTATVVTDLADVMLAGDHEGAFEPLTCSCGHAGCAGIDDPVSVHHVEDRIEWRFPASYIPRLAARGLARADDPSATFSFDSAAYRASVNAALERIAGWEREQACPVVIVAHDAVDPAEVPSIGTLTRQWRNSFATWRARQGTPEEHLGSPAEQQRIEDAVAHALAG